MIRFKKAVAADVPAPPAGYVTLFVDTATGQPSAKDSAGVVVSLKGAPGDPGEDGDDATGLPEGGTVGQVVTKTEDGAAWANAPAGGGGAPAGTWMNLLPPDGDCFALDGGDALASASTSGEISLEGDSEIGLRLGREFLNSTAMRLRGSMTVVLDVTKTDAEAEGAGGWSLQLKDDDSGALFAVIDIVPGSNEITFEMPIAPDSDAYPNISCGINCWKTDNVASAWASLEVVQFDALVEVTSEIETTALEMTAIPVTGLGVFGSGGFEIEQAGDLLGVTVIDIVGYYNNAKAHAIWDDNSGHSIAPVTSFYAPRLIGAGVLVEADYTALPEPITIATGGPGWASGHLSDLPEMSGMPDFDPDGDGWDNDSNITLCKVTLDGGAPVFALINNRQGT